MSLDVGDRVVGRWGGQSRRSDGRAEQLLDGRRMTMTATHSSGDRDLHRTYLLMKRRWNSDRSVSLTNPPEVSSSFFAQFLKTTSSSHRRLTAKSVEFYTSGYGGVAALSLRARRQPHTAGQHDTHMQKGGHWLTHLVQQRVPLHEDVCFDLLDFFCLCSLLKITERRWGC